MDFLHRSYKKELLDGDNIPFDAIERNMLELDTINTWLGGHAITLDGLKKLLKDKEQVSICEIGCGGGDNLAAIFRYCNRKGIRVKFTGIDNNAHCIAIARKKLTGTDATLLFSDYRAVDLQQVKPDIIFSSLFCHHFTDEELVEMLQWMRNHANSGFFINDLQRHPFAYHAIRLLTRSFSRSPLVKNDAPLSVLRGFSRKEWESLLKRSEILTYSLQWKWAFRWLLVVSKD
jgi:2-polyprenyl-3-methyl-5-hydroxy-6-metoxy-1,4-benzoquinol methylase